MTFSHLCVVVVLFIVIMFLTALPTIFDNTGTNDGLPWILSAMGFAMCLTYVLIDYGII